MFNSNPFFFKGLLRGRDRAKKNAEVQPELLSLCLCRGRAFTFTGRSSALPAILRASAKLENSFEIIKKREENFGRCGGNGHKKAENDHHGYFRHRFNKNKSGLRTLQKPADASADTNLLT